jgi:hypothetical protein
MLLFYLILKTKIHAAHTTFIDGIRACVFRKVETPRESGWISDIQRRKKKTGRCKIIESNKKIRTLHQENDRRS